MLSKLLENTGHVNDVAIDFVGFASLSVINCGNIIMSHYNLAIALFLDIILQAFNNFILYNLFIQCPFLTATKQKFYFLNNFTIGVEVYILIIFSIFYFIQSI